MIKCNLAVLLAERNLKISELSKRTGISRTTLTALSQNQSKGIQFDTFDTICNFLNIKPNDLFIQVPFEYDFEVIDILEDGTNKLQIGVNATVRYENFTGEYIFNCKAEFWHMDNLNRNAITDIMITPVFPSEINNTLNSVPITFKVSFENELLECLRAELIVSFNLDESNVNVNMSNFI